MNNTLHLRHIFSDTVIDLTDTAHLPPSVSLQCAFCRVLVRLPVDAHITLDVRSAFGSVTLPDRLPLLLGNDHAAYGSHNEHIPALLICAECALGALTFQMG